jgi:hypothetical protein
VNAVSVKGQFQAFPGEFNIAYTILMVRVPDSLA